VSRRTSLFPIVGIGASAGGIEALEGFFRGMPPEPGVGFVVVTHLNPERESLLHEVIARYTALKVNVAKDGARVAPNCVYVLPSDAILSIEGGRLHIHKPETGRRERKPIDIFFSALAADQGECAAGVVLSGGDGDGALGIKAIKERGGLTLAQVANGDGPRHPDMPASAIATGLVDFAIPADQMGDRLADFARSLLSPPVDAEADDGAALEEVFAILHNQVGHEFAGYKTRTFMRRVQRRMQVVRLSTLEAYVARLRDDPAEVNALFRDLLIQVTNFFRDADAFDKLAELVIPTLFEGRGAADQVRVWVPGCATGEEVFSIAILLREQMDRLKVVPRVQIFATDIDEHALAVARAGRYPEALLDSVSAERRKRFFVPDGGAYVLSKDVRELCVFSPHSVIRDPPFSRIDLVSCRNLLIYFGAKVQNQVIPTFHYSLRPGGYLFLGISENVSQFGELFTPLEKTLRIFRRREGASGRLRLPMEIAGLHTSAVGGDPPPRKAPVGALALRQMAEAQVLDRLSPAYVIADREGDVVYYSARTGKYLEPAAGAPTRQLAALARKGLRLDLRMAFSEAVTTGAAATRDGVEVEGEDGRLQAVSLTVEPMAGRTDGEDPLFLVLFDDRGAPVEREDAIELGRRQDDGLEAHLERELRDTRERLQSLVEEYETALEELKSSNEELISVNEEMQSTNEEMEASKEELQSLNEELHTVNAELNGKVEELDRANSDLRNLFEATEVATVFLDKDLVIRSFTPAATRVFNILPTDRGRPLTDLSGGVALPTLAEDVRAVFADGQVIQRRVTGPNATHYLVRLAAYRGSSSEIEGVVVTFVDVSSLTAAEAQQQVLIDELNHRVKNMLMVVIGVAEQTHAVAVSREAFRTSFLARLHAMARAYALLSRENWTEASIDELVRQELEPFGLERVESAGPSIRLKPQQALSVGMVLHELATNAGKYGALSTQDGHVLLAWSPIHTDAGPGMELRWREFGGPPVTTPTRRGFGLRLVEREAGHGLHGKALVDFAEDGLTVLLQFPLQTTEAPDTLVEPRTDLRSVPIHKSDDSDGPT
jgi:two-component system CheB/CheR fusion protein